MSKAEKIISELEKSTCCTCGYQWPTGQNGSHQCSIELLSKIEDLEKVLKTTHYSLHCMEQSGAFNKNALDRKMAVGLIGKLAKALKL